MDKKELQKRIDTIEQEMTAPDFWEDKDKAQNLIKELQDLKIEVEGGGKYDKGNAIVTILSGAGGDDAEDFSGILYRMYDKYSSNKNWTTTIIHQNENDHGGYRNITFEVDGKNAYGTLKYESGVHRLVRISPFSSKKLRHTSFSLVEVVPKFENISELEIPEDELEIGFTRSSGPGGQNANKRETSVRIVHKPTGLSASSEKGRSQVQNKEEALKILTGKIYHKREEDRKKEAQGLSISTTADIEWGSQIRSYVFHPYKMVKDHRTNVEIRDVDSIVQDGELDEFIDAMKNLE